MRSRTGEQCHSQFALRCHSLPPGETIEEGQPSISFLVSPPQNQVKSSMSTKTENARLLAGQRAGTRVRPSQQSGQDWRSWGGWGADSVWKPYLGKVKKYRVFLCVLNVLHKFGVWIFLVSTRQNKKIKLLKVVLQNTILIIFFKANFLIKKDGKLSEYELLGTQLDWFKKKKLSSEGFHTNPNLTSSL